MIARVRAEAGTGKFRNPITFIVEASDDIVYSDVDIEDGVKKGVLKWDVVEGYLRKHVDGAILEETLTPARKYVGSGKAFDEGEAMSQIFRVHAIGLMVRLAAKQFRSEYAAIMSGSYHGELVHDSPAKSLIDACQALAREYVYPARDILRLEVMGRHIIHELMDMFWDAVSRADPFNPDWKLHSFDRKVYELMSLNYRRAFEESLCKDELPHVYSRIQLVTDYICGMTW